MCEVMKNRVCYKSFDRVFKKRENRGHISTAAIQPSRGREPDVLKMLKKIKNVLAATEVSEQDYCQQIEAIIKCFEMYNITVKNRHWDDEKDTGAGKTESKT